MAMNAPHAQPQGCTNFKVRRLSRLLSHLYDAALAPDGLKITQYSLLKALGDLGPVSPGELARMMGMDASTLTRNLQPLSAVGWVRKNPGKDARSHLLEATPEGKAKLLAAKSRWKGAQLALNSRLGTQRVAQLHGLLDECATLLAAEDPRTPHSPKELP